MSLGIMDKLTNFLMPVEEENMAPERIEPVVERKTTQLRVHSPAALKVYIATPLSFDDVKLCADYLKANVAVLINFENVDAEEQQRIGDFLDGICFVTSGTNQRVSDSVYLYVPAHVDVNKELYAYSLPTYVKRKKDF